MNPMESVLSAHMSVRTSILSSPEKIDTTITIPPDGGWGWVIVFASFIVNLICDGAIYTFGIFLNDISATFEVEPTTVALASSLMTGFYYLSGPIGCAVVNRCGFQATGFIGALVVTSAFFICSYQETIVPFLIIFGVMGGMGFSLVYVPSVLVVGFYFDRWRSLATSLSAAGSAMGILGFPIIIGEMLSDLHWKVKFRILSGGCLLISLLVLTYKPLKPVRVLGEKKQATDMDTSDSVFEATGGKKMGFFKRIFNRFHNVTYPTTSQVHKEATVVIDIAGANASGSTIISSNELENLSFVSEEIGPSRSAIGGTTSRGIEARSLKSLKEQSDKKKCFKLRKCCRSFFYWGRKHKPMYRDDIFYTGPSLANVHSKMVSPSSFIVSKHSNMAQLHAIQSTVGYHMNVTRVGIKEPDEEKKVFNCCPESVVRTLVTMMNFHLLKSPAFCLIAFSGFFSLLGLFVPFIYIIEKSLECQIPKEKALKFFTALGISNLVGRILSGVISSLPHMNALLISYISLFICGLITAAAYFICDTIGHFVFISIFGATMACLFTLRAPILVDLLGLEALTNAFGLILLFQGLAAFIGLPLAGAVVSLAGGSYNPAFLFSGLCIMLSAVLLMPVKKVSKWEAKKRKENTS